MAHNFEQESGIPRHRNVCNEIEPHRRGHGPLSHRLPISSPWTKTRGTRDALNILSGASRAANISSGSGEERAYRSCSALVPFRSSLLKILCSRDKEKRKRNRPRLYCPPEASNKSSIARRMRASFLRGSRSTR